MKAKSKYKITAFVKTLKRYQQGQNTYICPIDRRDGVSSFVP